MFAEHRMNALILVDLQNDFMPGGALAVPHGDEVVPVANRLIAHAHFDCIVATQDWHPAYHGSFAVHHPGHQPGDIIDLNGLSQILWPVHCVQDTPGAAFHADLATDRIERIFPKGTDPGVDSYSGFFDNGHRQATGLGDYLRERGVTAVYIMGLATDYCVQFTALDAVQLGFKTYLITDGCRGVNLQPEDSHNAIAKMQHAGITLVDSAALCKTA